MDFDTKMVKKEDPEFEKKIILTEELADDEDISEDGYTDDEVDDDEYEIDTVISILKDIKEFVEDLSFPLAEKLKWEDIQLFINNDIKVFLIKDVDYERLDA